MTRRITVIAALLACATASSAVLAPFPHGKTTSYRYQTTVASTTSDEELINSSQFVMQGTLYVTHDNRDPELTNAYSVALSDVKTDMHNGDHVDYEGKPVVQPIDANANVIQKPFLIIYSADGIFEAVKIDAKEPEWSKNMKMAMASMLQLDLANIKAVNSANRQHSFVSQEKTIHGDCMVNYNVYPKEGMHSNGPERLLVNMTFSPMNCSGFAIHEFNNVDYPQCKREKEPRMFSNSAKIYEIEKQDGGLIIKKLVADGNINVLSSNGASYPHFVITKTTLELNQVQDKSDKELGNFADSPIIRDVTYRKPEERYSSDAAIDVTQGRHVVDLKKMPFELKELLIEALTYIEENHFDPKLMDWKHSQTMIEILHLMSYMNVDKLQTSYTIFEDMVHPRAGTIKKIFLDVVSEVGTPAACFFIRDLISSNKVPTMTAVEMLTKFPLSVRTPTPELVAQMEDLNSLDDSVSVEVKKAGILSVATLVHRTFKHLSQPKDKATLDRYIQTLYNRVKEEPTYEMKIVYLMAIKNIQIGGIHNILEPVINGSLAISKKPEQLRLMAIWAIDKAVENNYDDAHRILWPVMVNDSLPTKLRIAAYEILLNQLPDENSAIKLHQYVNKQGNHHFYNYHYRTLDVIAKSVDPCKTDVRTFAKNILKNIVWPPKSHENIHYTLSQVESVGYASYRYADAEEIEYGMIVNELTGIPEVLRYKRIFVDDDGAVSDFEIQIHSEGLKGLFETVTGYSDFSKDDEYSDVEKLLKKAAETLPPNRDFHLDIVVLSKDRVFMVNHYDFETLYTVVNDHMMQYFYQMEDSFKIDYQRVIFDRMSEKQLTSDVGIPIIITTRAPTLKSLKINFKTRRGPSPILDLAVEFKSMTHDDRSMSVYNPMKDVWHSVRAKTALELQLPLRTTFSFDESTKTARLSFPERDGAKPVAVGLIMRGNHFVTVDEDANQALKKSCSDCRHQKIVYHTNMKEGKSDEYEKSSYDSKDVGLEFTAFIYHSHSEYLSEPYFGYTTNWDASFQSNISSRWDDVFRQRLMVIHEVLRDSLLDALLRSTGGIFKAEPSTENSISHIDLKLGGDYIDYDVNETNTVVLHAERFEINGTVDVVSSRNKTVRLWDFNVDIDLGRNHLANEASIKINRKTPEEIDFKICINAKKNYPVPPEDDLKIVDTTEKINSKVTLTYGYTNEDECAKNETLLKVVVKAELSDEQKKRWNNDMKNSPCSKDKKNPMYATSKNSVPRTLNCMDEAILYTSLRKYNVDVMHEKLSMDTAWSLYRRWTYGMEPKENGNFKFQADFAMNENAVDFQWMNDDRSFTKKRTFMNDLFRDGRGPVMTPLYDFPLDNTRFTITQLLRYSDDDMRICSVYPKTVMTADGDDVAFNIPSDQWTLISGDHGNNKFAIFANQPRPNYLSFVVLIRNHAVRFYTRESDNVLVAEAPGDVEPTDNGFELPIDDDFIWNLKVIKRNDNFVVRLRQLPLELLVGPNYISVSYLTRLGFQGYVSGLCGRLNGTSIYGHPETLSMKEMPESL